MKRWEKIIVDSKNLWNAQRTTGEVVTLWKQTFDYG